MHLSIKIANNKRFKYFQHKSWFFLYHLTKKKKIKEKQFYLLFFIIINFKIISKKLLSQINPAKAYTFFIYKKREIIMIDEYKNIIFTIFQIMLPYFYNFNNSQKFTIMSLITYFGCNHFLQKISNIKLLIQIVSSQLT